MDKKPTKYWRVLGLWLVMLCGMPAIVLAEIQYVSDTLRVGVRAEPDRSLSSIIVIETGAAVEVLDKAPGYMHIRTATGVEGWVRSRYLSQHKPAMLLLDELKLSRQALRDELDSLQAKKLTAGENATVVQALKDKAKKLAKENRELRGLVAGESGSDDNTWLYWFSGILAIGPLGFLAGLLWYRYQIMKKLGGLTL